MTTVTESITVTLMPAVGGLLAEVSGLPVQSGPEYLRVLRNRELAECAVKQRYPELLVRSASRQGETSYLVWVERV